MIRKLRIALGRTLNIPIPVLTLTVLSLFLLAAAGCAGGGDEELVIYSSRTSSLVQPLLERYADETGVNIRVKYANTASTVATLLEEGQNSRADVVYLADPSGWAALSQAGILSRLPESLLDQVDSRFRSSRGEWVGASGRSKVVVYNTRNIDPARDLPQSIMDFTDSKWKGRIGWAPTHSEWQILLMAIRLEKGEEAARQWLEGIKANEPRSYPNLISIVQAVATGEVDVGFVNHYYVPRFIEEEGEDFGARNYYIGHGDPGAVIDVAGVAIVETASDRKAAEGFVAYMLGAEAQRYFSERTHEYPVSAGVQPSGDLPPLSSLDPPNINPAELSELESTIKMLRDAGIIP
ncbi:MAG: iron ABC transporter substrate-binding protein [Chloroflexi bacterium]|nr:iron ABC transporter substrate-binding protein [Chloroflexota bacterium]MDA1271853.1 iron ABC transporter substrate-binding protein [Chloroflexota bacterium]